MRQSGRAVALWALGLYGASLLAVLPVLDHWPPLPYNTGSYKWRQLCERVAQAPDRALLVMIGSSRIEGLFQAARLDGMPCEDGKRLLAYNFGAPAAGPAHELLYVSTMLQAGIRPRLLLVEYLPLMLNEPHRGLISEENWTSAPWRSLTEMSSLSPYWARPLDKWRDWVEARLAPWYAFRWHEQGWLSEALFAAKPREKPFVYDTWGHQVLEKFSAAQIVRRHLLSCYYNRPTLQRLQLGSGPTQALHDLLELCRREQVPLLLVVTPESSSFRSWYSPEALAGTRRLLQELQRDYGVGVIDARQWLADTDFDDGHHVLDSGGNAFTTRLLEELRPLLLAQRSP
jgi:hypothetical protein